MVPYFTCGFEDASIGTHWDITNGTSALDSSVAGRTGVNAGRLDVVSAVLTNIEHTLGAHSAYAATLRFRLSTVTTSNTTSLLRLSGSAYDAQFTLFTDHTIDFTAGGAAGSSLGTINANQWYTLQFWVDGTAHTAGWRLDGVTQPPPTVSVSNSTFSILILGHTSAVSAGTYSLYFDDILTTLDPADHPIVSGYDDASDAWVTSAADYSYRPVILTSRYRGPQSLRREFRHPVIYGGDVAAAGPQNLFLTAADSLTFGESMDRLFTGFRTTTDSTTYADAATRAVTLLRAATDAVARADVAARLVTLLRAASDSTTYADAATRTATLLRSATDAVARTEAATRTVTLLRSVTDSVTYSDVAAQVKSIARQATDSVTYSDAATRTVTLLRAATDAVTRSDAATRTVTLLRTVTDSVTWADVAAQVKSTARSATDSITMSDSAVRTVTLLRSATDSTTYADAAARAVTFLRTAADAVTRSDAATRTGTFLRSVGETVTRTEVITVIGGVVALIGGLPPVASASRFIARAMGRSPRPDASATDANRPKSGS